MMSTSSNSRSDENPTTCLLDQLGVKVRHLVADSRKLKPGDTFLACAGERHDARNDIPQAIALGVNAIIWEKQGFSWKSEWKIPNLGIAGLRHEAGKIASEVYGHPSRHYGWLESPAPMAKPPAVSGMHKPWLLWGKKLP